VKTFFRIEWKGYEGSRQKRELRIEYGLKRKVLEYLFRRYREEGLEHPPVEKESKLPVELQTFEDRVRGSGDGGGGDEWVDVAGVVVVRPYDIAHGYYQEMLENGIRRAKAKGHPEWGWVSNYHAKWAMRTATMQKMLDELRRLRPGLLKIEKQRQAAKKRRRRR